MTERMENLISAGKSLKTVHFYSPLVAFIFLLPFIQMGFSYYVSVQIFLFLYLIYRLQLNYFVKNSHWIFIFFILMIFPALFYTVDDQLHMALRAFREFICLMVLLAVLSYKSKVGIVSNKVERYVLSLLTVLFLVVFVQFLALKSGYSLHVPSELLIANQNTVESVEMAVEFDLYGWIRPTAFYGEPSYLSFIVISLLFITFSLFEDRKNVFIAVLLILSICLFSKSLAGVLSLFSLSLIYYSRFNFRRTVAIAIFILLLLTYMMFFSEDIWFMNRILSIREGVSSVRRLFEPFEAISYSFKNYPFGMPREILDIEFVEFIATDNGLLNLFINYGYSGFIILGSILYKLKTSALMMTYVLLSAMFNGGFLSFDKVAIIGLALLLVSHLRINLNMHSPVFINSKVLRK